LERLYLPQTGPLFGRTRRLKRAGSGYRFQQQADVSRAPSTGSLIVWKTVAGS
jgi:hypothetical protein